MKTGGIIEVSCHANHNLDVSLIDPKACLNGFNICPTFISTKVEGMLGKCWTNVEQSVQIASTPFNIFRAKEMLNQC